MAKKLSIRQKYKQAQLDIERVAAERDSARREVARLRRQIAEKPKRRWYNPLTWLR